MRIHIVGINYWPEVTGIAPFNTGRAEHLAAHGHTVTMCTAVPYYPTWRVQAPYRNRWFSRESRAGVEILRCRLYVPAKVTPLRRIIHEASFILTTFVRSLFCRRPDVLVIVSPPLGLSVAAWILSRIWRVPFVMDVEDLQPDAAMDLGMMRRGLLTRALFALERFAYRHATAISTLTDQMRARIVAKGVPETKVTVTPPWADPELFDLADDDASIRREFGLGDAKLIVHAGNMGVKQGLDVVLDAADRMRDDPKTMFVLVGDGAMRTALESKARSQQLTNLRIIPLLPREAFLRLLAVATACLVTQQRSVADIVFPSKVMTLMAAGKPIVASVNSESAVARAIAEADAGLIVDPENPEALTTPIRALLNDPARCAAMGRRGRAHAQARWQRHATLREFEDMLMRAATATTRGAVRPAVPTIVK